MESSQNHDSTYRRRLRDDGTTTIYYELCEVIEDLCQRKGKRPRRRLPLSTCPEFQTIGSLLSRPAASVLFEMSTGSLTEETFGLGNINRPADILNIQVSRSWDSAQVMNTTFGVILPADSSTKARVRILAANTINFDIAKA